MKTKLPAFLSIVILGSAAILFSGQAGACKLAPEAFDLAVFMSSDHANKVVFKGEVESVTMDAPAKHGEQVQIIHFKSERWWLGQAREKLSARGVMGSVPGTSCAGVFDFTVKNREVWLIAGYEENGVIYPSPQLSRRLVNGQIPADLRKLLQSRRIGPGH
ncbi:hypothetical protein ACEN9F_31495 [Duganella sp. CT11-25]|jgi:hypothetical protein|uniref:hypothetical protein n=1 Tax=unclassified Duganella TaxID=2636909 RepID=UPI0039AF52B8